MLNILSTSGIQHEVAFNLGAVTGGTDLLLFFEASLSLIMLHLESGFSVMPIYVIQGRRKYRSWRIQSKC